VSADEDTIQAAAQVIASTRRGRYVAMSSEHIARALAAAGLLRTAHDTAIVEAANALVAFRNFDEVEPHHAALAAAVDAATQEADR
jgi:hypothetical protein